MVKERLSFSQGTDAFRAYEALSGLGLGFSSLDTGCHRVSYSSLAEATPSGKGNKTLSTCEVYTHLADQGLKLSSTVQSLFGSAPTWFLPATSSDKELKIQLQKIDQEIRRLQKKHHGDKDRDLKIAKGLYEYVVSIPGLGIGSVDEIRENSAEKVLNLGQANCSEFFALFRAIFARAGLKVSPVYIFESATGDKNGGHVATAFQFGGKTYLMDPFYDGFNTRHSRWAPLSLREYWAWHFNNRALLAGEAGRISEAEKLFTRAEQLDPNNPWFPNNLGLILEKQGRKTDAKIAYVRANAVDAKFVDSYLNLGALYLNASKWKEALVPLKQGYHLNPKDERILYNLATAHYELGNYRKALLVIDSGIGQNKNNSDFFSLRGDILSKLGRNSEAQKSRAKAIHLKSTASE